MEQYGLPKGFLGCGFKFPIQGDENTGRMMTVSYEEDIKEAIRIILMTRKGERVRMPEFGCRIHEYAFADMDYTTINTMKREVERALVQWEPRIDEIEVVMDTAREREGMLLIRISYRVRSTNNPYNMVFPYYLNEGFGTEL